MARVPVLKPREVVALLQALGFEESDQASFPMTHVLDGHIEITDEGFAKLAGSRIKVYQLVEAMQVNGWTVDEYHEQFPHLPLVKIYAALTYYYSHQDEIDRQIKETNEFAERMRLEAGESPVAKRLRAEGRLK